jgi:hypothetical protein
MTAIVRALSELAATNEDAEALNWVMIFSSVGLFVSLLYLINGIDISGRIF